MRRRCVPSPSGSSSTSTVLAPGLVTESSASQPQVKTARRGGSSSTYSPLATSRPLMSQWKTPPGRGSSSAERPIHWIILSGSVKKSKTVSGPAAIRTSTSVAFAVSAFATFVPPLLLQLGGQLQPLETIGPELVQEVAQAAERLGLRA